MNHVSTSGPKYVLGHSKSEVLRLERQGELLKPFTERALRAAGLEPGMRVLDIGCGAGDVSMLVAEIVGETGSVLGIDSEATVLERARTRSASIGNIQYAAANLDTLPVETFDAVVGRCVLMYQPDQPSFLRQAAARLRPGGILCSMEICVWEYTRPGAASSGIWSSPPAPLYDEMHGLIGTAFALGGARVETGARFVALFDEAGLGEPTLHEEVPTGGADSPVVPWAYATFASLLPTLEKHAVTTARDIGFETLLDRVTAQVRTNHSQVRFAHLSSAWLRLPG